MDQGCLFLYLRAPAGRGRAVGIAGSWSHRQRKIMHALEDFNDIVRAEEPLAPHTYLKVGGPAEVLMQPRSLQELTAVMQRCAQKKVAVRVLGGGCNILVPDEGVRGVVLRLSEPAFTQVEVDGRK